MRQIYRFDMTSALVPLTVADAGLTALAYSGSLRPAAAENKNVFVMKRDAAAALGVSTLSDLEAHWPAAG